MRPTGLKIFFYLSKPRDNNGMVEISLIISILVSTPNEDAKPFSRISLLIIYDFLHKPIQRNQNKQEWIGNQFGYSHKHRFYSKISLNLDIYLMTYCLVYHSGTLDELYLVFFVDIKRLPYASLTVLSVKKYHNEPDWMYNLNLFCHDELTYHWIVSTNALIISLHQTNSRYTYLHLFLFGLHKYEMLFLRFQFIAGFEVALYSALNFKRPW